MAKMLTKHPRMAQAECNAHVDELDVGAGANATIELGDDSSFTNVLAIFDLDDPAYDAASLPSAGSNSIAAIASVPINSVGLAAAGAGTPATYARSKDKDGTVMETGTAGVAGSQPGSEDPWVVLNNATIIEDQPVQIVSGTYEVRTSAPS